MVVEVAQGPGGSSEDPLERLLICASESPADVGVRVDRVLDRVRARLADGDVALVAHGHVLRILTARWLGLAPEDGALFALSAGSFGVLGHEHERPVLSAWAVH